MQLTGNTLLITGGGTGIGRAFAEAFHHLGNKVIIAGRRPAALDAVMAANPGMEAVELDIADPASIDAVAADVRARFPGFNMLINNAGVMMMDDAGGAIDNATAMTMVNTNFLGAVRMSSAFVETLKAQPSAAIVTITSVLGFVPFARAAVYSASKAALHAYIMAQRHRLRDTPVSVIEIIPPRVQVDPDAGTGDVSSIPLARFIDDAMALLGTDAEEIVVDEARSMRANPGPREHEFVTRLNSMLERAHIE
ncbi:SDR family oxidoreductase [Novosphingobium sp. KN65.2]|uniref:SDR family oxidoreductase n=1 Tax=Novosphingobium sp. KN65.2 TaxID=1478134 RepID=UPI0005E73AD3|nr:SDR family NAD(P)-dependent oxidoreductase [Novosphingobium sp. KN65.2]CDO36601.1 Short-chain dehydrogenase/reductase SDR [Novosphingobium sp. KN65.2]